MPNVLSIAPEAGAPTELVVLLHGVGAEASSFHAIARALAPTLPQAELLTPDGFQPYAQAPTGRQWFSRLGLTDANRPTRVREAGEEVSRWIDGELAARGLGRDRLVVVGFSQGAMVAAWLAVHRAPPPAAVVMCSGRFADDAVPVAGSVSTPVFMGHGTDDAVMSPAVSEPSARALEAWGARVTRRSYPGLGHQIDERELRDVAAFLKAALGRAP
jgi:phospholipase/carboxylesterase